jgi:hypothetical protein
MILLPGRRQFSHPINNNAVIYKFQIPHTGENMVIEKIKNKVSKF